MRVLMVAFQSYLPVGYRGKLRWLATEGGVDLTLATMRAWQGPTGTEIWQEAKEPFDVRFIQPTALAAHPTMRWVAPKTLRALIDDVQPDIVHVEAEPHALLMATIARMRRAYKLVGFTWENIHRQGRPPLGWLERGTLRRVDAMVSGNAEGVDVLRWRGFSGELCPVIPQWGFDPAPFTEERSAPPALADDRSDKAASSLRIAYVGRLAEEKGITDLVTAMGRLPADTRLYLAGSGSAEGALCEQVRQSGLEDRVRLLGSLSHDQVLGLLQHVDALVLPSRTLSWWKEQFGRVLVEAMLSSAVVVGSDSGAIPDVIGDAGLVFPEGDVDALAERLQRLIDDETLRARLADAGRQRALALYTDAAIGRAHLDLYRSMMGAP